MQAPPPPGPPPSGPPPSGPPPGGPPPSGPPPSGPPGTPGAAPSFDLPPWAAAAWKRALGPGPLIGAGISAALLYWPTHSLGTAIGSGIWTFIVIGGLRAADPYLKPVWLWLGRIPWQARYAAGVGLPLLYSRSRFTPEASGQEISRARGALLMSAVIAYVLMRPKRENQPRQGPPVSG